MKRTIIAALALYASIASASAKPPSGYDLYLDCTGSTADQVACMSYVMGAWDTLSIMGDVTDKPQVCGGSTWTAINGGQALLLFKRWAETHPQYLSHTRGESVIASLKEAYPCGTSPKTSSAPRLLRQ